MRNYKSFFCVFILIVLLVLSSCITYVVSNLQGRDYEIHSVKPYEYIDPQKEGWICYEDEIITDEVIAKKYSDLILENTLNEKLIDYKVHSIYLDEKNGIWMINYGIDENTLGGDISIALSKITGEVIKIWFGE